MLTMNIRCNGANTFIDVAGNMTAEGMAALGRQLAEHFDKAGEGRCFITTDGMTLPMADATSHEVRKWMHSLVQDMGVAPSSVYFKGKHAFALAPDGCRVIAHRSKSREGKPQTGAQPVFLRDSHALHRCATHVRAAPATTHAGNVKKPGCTGNCETCPRCKGKAMGH